MCATKHAMAQLQNESFQRFLLHCVMPYEYRYVIGAANLFPLKNQLFVAIFCASRQPKNFDGTLWLFKTNLHFSHVKPSRKKNVLRMTSHKPALCTTLYSLSLSFFILGLVWSGKDVKKPREKKLFFMGLMIGRVLVDLWCK